MALHTTHKDNRELVTDDRLSVRHARRVAAAKASRRAGTKSTRDYEDARWLS